MNAKQLKNTLSNNKIKKECCIVLTEQQFQEYQDFFYKTTFKGNDYWQMKASIAFSIYFGITVDYVNWNKHRISFIDNEKEYQLSDEEFFKLLKVTNTHVSKNYELKVISGNKDYATKLKNFFEGK